MKITILGATGTLGRLVADHLTAAGLDVVPASRTSGVDAATGAGLEEALAGSEVAIDCLNVETMSARRAVPWFTTAATHVASTARRTGVRQVVCVSIAGASDPRVHGRLGYYRGKAAQEATYRSSAIPVTLVHSTQWFELVPDLVRRASLGPVTILPTMRMAAVAADSVARLVADQAVAAPPSKLREVAIRGPEVATGAEIARTILAARGSIAGRRPRVLTELPYLGRAVATDGLLPRDAIVDPVGLTGWLSRPEQ